MSIITAIFQAVFQAICWIIPISESAHSSMFHDFASRFSGNYSALTGVVHIGIAVGIALAMLKFFLKLGRESVSIATDLFKKQIKGTTSQPLRHFVLMNLLSFVPMILWLIPCGKAGFLFSVLRKTQYNATLLDDGVFLALTGALLFFTMLQLPKGNNQKPISLAMALVVGALSVFLVPVSGFALIGVVFCVLVLMGAKTSFAYRYGFILSVPVLFIMGIVEVCTAITQIGVVSIILGLLVSIVVSFAMVRVFRHLIKTLSLRYVAIYDIAAGAIAIVVGIFELILR